MTSSWKCALLACASLVTLAARGLDAQTCFGLPSRGAVAYENVRYTIGTGHGVNIGYGGAHLAVGGAFNTRDISSDVSGMAGSARVAAVVPISRVQLCPGIKLAYMRDKWETPGDVDLTSQQLSARAGAGVGIEQPLYKGLTIIPSLGVHYDFTVIKYDIAAPSGENQTSGDTLSHVAIDYSLALRYRFAYVGASALRYSDTKGPRPLDARLFIGFAFGSGRDDGSNASTR